MYKYIYIANYLILEEYEKGVYKRAPYNILPGGGLRNISLDYLIIVKYFLSSHEILFKDSLREYL